MVLVSNRLDTARRTEQDQHNATGTSVYSKHGDNGNNIVRKNISSFLHLYPNVDFMRDVVTFYFIAPGTIPLPCVSQACYLRFAMQDAIHISIATIVYSLLNGSKIIAYLTPRETKHNRRPRLFSIKETESRPASTWTRYLTFQHFETLVLSRIAPVEVNNTGK